MFGRSAKFLLGATATLALLASTAAVAAPVVEATSALPVATVDRDQLDKLPTGRRLEDLIRTCPSTTIPTVSRRPDILIDGKPSVDLNCIQPADIEMIEVFKVHNELRAQYGASPLAWDRILEVSAGQYVGQLARTGKMVHAPREGRGTVRENISQGLPNYRARQLMDNWLSERRYFTPGIFPNVSSTGDWSQVGHLSQMLWPTTAVIGCARGIGAGSSWLVCRYDPGGNKDGKPVGQPAVLAADPASSVPRSEEGSVLDQIEESDRAAEEQSRAGAATAKATASPPPPPAQLTEQDQKLIGAQQKTIDDVERYIEELNDLRRKGRCKEMLEAAELLRKDLEGLVKPKILNGREMTPFPPTLIDEWRRRVNEAIQPCPAAPTP